MNVEENYDLVISTSLLPGYNGKYKLISPLLLDDEIRQLKEEFKRISHEKRSLRKAPVEKNRWRRKLKQWSLSWKKLVNY